MNVSARRDILIVLNETPNWARPAAALFDDVNRRVRPPLTKVEFAEHLGWLCDKGFIGFRPDSVAPEEPELRRWSIKEQGQVYLDA